ncbi:hypothetical protein HA402_013714 [Bradysia odoriphaga]|nr:hypothetical protein HA402_013714 [Bradysia odoriphaga]
MAKEKRDVQRMAFKREFVKSFLSNLRDRYPNPRSVHNERQDDNLWQEIGALQNVSGQQAKNVWLHVVRLFGSEWQKGGKVISRNPDWPIFKKLIFESLASSTQTPSKEAERKVKALEGEVMQLSSHRVRRAAEVEREPMPKTIRRETAINEMSEEDSDEDNEQDSTKGNAESSSNEQDEKETDGDVSHENHNTIDLGESDGSRPEKRPRRTATSATVRRAAEVEREPMPKTIRRETAINEMSEEDSDEDNEQDSTKGNAESSSNEQDEKETDGDVSHENHNTIDLGESDGSRPEKRPRRTAPSATQTPIGDNDSDMMWLKSWHSFMQQLDPNTNLKVRFEITRVMSDIWNR